MKMQEFIKTFIDENKKQSKSYYISKNNHWNLSRCRIEPKLIPEFIYDYFYSRESAPKLCEYYLNRSRQLQRKEKIYKKSKGMDSSAIISWFKLKGNFKKEDTINYLFQDLEDIIIDYVNQVIKENCFDENRNFFKKWNDYYSQIKNNNDYNELIKLIKKNNKLEYVKEVEKVDKIIDIQYKNNKENFLININNEEKLEHIGKIGEEIILNELIKWYGKENVEWVSKNNKYSPYDLKVNLNGDEIYCEVKSTTKPNYFNFFISSNELKFYNEHKDKYWLIFISNIDKNKDYIPNMTIYKKPQIHISFKEKGFRENNIYITPYTYYI